MDRQDMTFMAAEEEAHDNLKKASALRELGEREPLRPHNRVPQAQTRVGPTSHGSPSSALVSIHVPARSEPIGGICAANRRCEPHGARDGGARSAPTPVQSA